MDVISINHHSVCGSFIERTVGVTESETPAVRLQDNVDYVPMPWHKVFLIQFLNIAGTGPILGAIAILGLFMKKITKEK